MISTIRGLLQPASFFDPIGTPLGEGLPSFLIVFGAIFVAGFVLRGLSIFVTRWNPFLRTYLKRLSFVLLVFGLLEVTYFLVREVRVAYITENIVFIVMTSACLLWLMYVVIIGYFVRYRREKVLYKIEQERRQYLPKKKKK